MHRPVRTTHGYLVVFVAVAALLAATVPSIGHAQGLALPDLGGLIPSTFQNLDSAVNVIWNTVVGVAGIAFLGYLLYGGFLFLTSAGNEEVAEKARHTLRDAAIGMALVVLAWPIGALVLTILGQQGIIKGGSSLQVPTATSSAPFTPITSSSTPGGSSAPGGSSTGGTTSPCLNLINSLPTQCSSSTSPTVGADGSATYATNLPTTPTDVSVLDNKKLTTVPNERLNFYVLGSDGTTLEPLFLNYPAGADGKVSLALPSNKQIVVYNALDKNELFKGAVVGNSLQVFVPSSN